MLPKTPIPVVGRTFATERMIPPGIVTGAAYADLDALGTAWPFYVPASGIIQSAEYWDLDDEGLAVDLVLFDSNITPATDNSALALSDFDALKIIKRISFSSFADFGNNQKSEAENIGKAYVLKSRQMWAQVQARGALNIAAANLPQFRLTILADE